MNTTLLLDTPEWVEEVRFTFPSPKNTLKPNEVKLTASRSTALSTELGGYVVKTIILDKQFLQGTNIDLLQQTLNDLFNALIPYKDEQHHY